MELCTSAVIKSALKCFWSSTNSLASLSPPVSFYGHVDGHSRRHLMVGGGWVRRGRKCLWWVFIGSPLHHLLSGWLGVGMELPSNIWYHKYHCIGAWETAQWVKFFLYKHEDLSSMNPLKTSLCFLTVWRLMVDRLHYPLLFTPGILTDKSRYVFISYRALWSFPPLPVEDVCKPKSL